MKFIILSAQYAGEQRITGNDDIRPNQKTGGSGFIGRRTLVAQGMMWPGAFSSGEAVSV